MTSKPRQGIINTINILLNFVARLHRITSKANGHKVVGQQLATILGVVAFVLHGA